MIVVDDLEMVLTCPVKTGTYSQVRALTGKAVCGKKIGARHALHLPDSVPETYLRVLSVRHPLERLVSLWSYALDSARKPFGKQWRWKIWTSFVHDPVRFFDWLLEPEQVESRHYWVLTLSDYVEAFNPDVVVFLENLQAGYDRLFEALGVPAPRFPRENASKRETNGTLNEVLPVWSRIRSAVYAHVERDFEVIGYDIGYKRHPQNDEGVLAMSARALALLEAQRSSSR